MSRALAEHRCETRPIFDVRQLFATRGLLKFFINAYVYNWKSKEAREKYFTFVTLPFYSLIYSLYSLVEKIVIYLHVEIVDTFTKINIHFTAFASNFNSRRLLSHVFIRPQFYLFLFYQLTLSSSYIDTSGIEDDGGNRWNSARLLGQTSLQRQTCVWVGAIRGRW